MFGNSRVTRVIFSCCLSLLIGGLSLITPSHAFAQSYSPIDPESLKKEIDDFAKAGAKGYLVWQYGGSRGGGMEFENDKYSFFQNVPPEPDICAALLEKSKEYDGKMFIGVNVWSAGDPKFTANPSYLDTHFRHLKNDCGVSVIRVFAKAGGGDGMRKVLDIADPIGIDVIIALGDYSNGGGGIPKGANATWYKTGYTGEYMTFVKEVTAAVGANHPGLYGYELANEPHCSGDPLGLAPYTDWAKNVSSFLQGFSKSVGLGQMASHENSLCDSPGPGHFKLTNAASSITMTSGHYYDAAEKATVMAALAQNPAGKLFYIGEAGWGGDDLEPDPYFLYPIRGLSSEDPGAIFNDLVDQGYETQCSTPMFKVAAVGNDQLNQLKELVKRGQATIQNRSVNADQVFDYTQSTVPIWRDSNPVATLMGSLEDFWGFQDLKSKPNDPQGMISSSPIYKLLNREKQCDAKVEILTTIEKMCKQLDDPSTCALYQPIPGVADFNTKKALEAWRSFNLSCAGINNPDLGPDEKLAVQAVMNTPLYLDKAYRLAFLVITTELQEQTGFFNFLRRSNATFSPKHEVRVIAFKIPDIGTNQPVNGLGYQDPLIRTRNTRLEQPAIEQLKQEAQSERDRLRVDQGTGIIECGGDNCTDPLTQALVRLVNNNGQACEKSAEELKYEASNSISTSGDLTPGPGTKFSDESDPAEELFTSPADQLTEPQVATFNFLSQLRMGAEGKNDTKTNAYLVYPMGRDLASTTKILLTFFGKEWGETFTNNPDATEYFKLDGITQELTSDTAEVPFADPTKACTLNPLTGKQVCGTQIAEAKIEAKQEDAQPRILGGYLGYLSKLVQATQHVLNSKPYLAVMSCKTTEDFLLGRCDGKNPLSSAAGKNLPGMSCSITGGLIKNPANQSEWIGGEMIKSNSLKALVADAAKKYNVPVQVLMSTMWLETCRTAGSICNLSDAEIQQYSAPGAEYPYNCAGGGGGTTPFTGKSKGPFQFYHNLCSDTNGNGQCEANEKLIDWGFTRESASDNICNVRDSIYGAAKLLAYNYNRSGSAPAASQWSLEDGKRTLTRWAANVDSCDAHPFANEYCGVLEDLWSGKGKVTTNCN